jgi:hypothetical protein
MENKISMAELKLIASRDAMGIKPKKKPKLTVDSKKLGRNSSRASRPHPNARPPKPAKGRGKKR